MDIKTPGSGEQDSGTCSSNLQHLKPSDQLKIRDLRPCNDYEWAKEFRAEHGLLDTCAVLFSPSIGQLEPRDTGRMDTRRPAAGKIPGAAAQVPVGRRARSLVYSDLMSNTRSVILLSGGMDSATTLAIARDAGEACYALSFDYGQKHNAELNAAKAVADHLGVIEHRVVTIDMAQLGGSALTDAGIDVPEAGGEGIPVTYVPARNTVFLSLGLAWAEVVGANKIYAGVNAVDYSGYPDCRPEYIDAFQAMANLALKRTVEGERLDIATPLIDLSKSDIVALGSRLGVDYSLTVSCYSAADDGAACGHCDACELRRRGFAEAGIPDPTRYA